MTSPTCYCGATTSLRRSEYGHFYACDRPSCEGLVGCHPGTTKPLGTPADKMTRQARHRVHLAFDRLWKSDDGPSRGGAYHWLAGMLGLDPEDCHIGMFDLETCKRAARIAANTSPAEVKVALDQEEATA